MTLTLAHVTFDCADAVKLASFWATAFDRTVDEGASPFFASIGYNTADGLPSMLFLQVGEGKTAKNRMHLDTHADDREAEVERLVQLGATRIAEKDEYGTRWTVMNDPEGNEFCIAQNK